LADFVTHSVRLDAFAIVIAVIAGTVCGGTADASDLVLSRDALQALVTSTLFRDGGRWYLQKGACYAYLEHPVVALARGRMIVDARLSARLGLESQGGCIGVDATSPVSISGVPRGSGSELSIKDVRAEHADVDATRQALDLLLDASADSISRALTIDLMTVVKPTAIPGLPMPARLTRLIVSDVVTGKQSVTVHFDLGVAVP
jgi:hypothetical protein